MSAAIATNARTYPFNRFGHGCVFETAANEEKKTDIAYYHSEQDVNSWGYQLLRLGKKQQALEVFKLNTILHPESFNAYDSLA